MGRACRAGPGAVGAALVLTLAGCATGPRAPAPPAPGALSLEEAVALAARWEVQWEAFTGLRAVVDFRVTRRGRSDRTAAGLLLSPTALRLEVTMPFGFPALVATAQPEQLTIFRPLERKAQAGRPTPEAVNRWLGVPLDLETLIRLLIGQVPRPDPGTVRIEPGPSPHLVYERGGVRHRVWVNAAGQPTRLAVAGSEPVTVGFEWTMSGHLQSLHAAAPSRDTEMSLRYISAEDASLPPEAFELLLPVDVTLERLD